MYSYIYITLPGTQVTHILEDLDHKMEGQPPKNITRVHPIAIHGFFVLCLNLPGAPMWN